MSGLADTLGDTALIVFAKAPEAGRAKTRLIPALGAEGAAALAARLLDHALQQAADAGLAALELCVAPDATHPRLQAAAARHGAALTLQGEGDLGARMQRALSRRLALHERVLLIGTDAPSLDARVLHAAAAALDGHDAVFVPALDGGYALVGLARFGQSRAAGASSSTGSGRMEGGSPSTGSGRTGVDPFGLSPSTELRTGLSKPPSTATAAPERLFESIEWSTATVMARTLERVAELGLRVALLRALPDIDEPADLVHLPPSWPEARRP
jgi:rSAM/selenodomain-associated transferase 1